MGGKCVRSNHGAFQSVRKYREMLVGRKYHAATTTPPCKYPAIGHNTPLGVYIDHFGNHCSSSSHNLELKTSDEDSTLELRSHSSDIHIKPTPGHLSPFT
ncbi:hypothetical protein TNCV_4808521 [Trichonephila clavipes]|nr:hypothetical protein TNCV_4808521 [Trichonephila clavipes]